MTEKMPAVIITILKLVQTFIAASAGKTTSAVIKSEPTRFIASTITMAVIIVDRNGRAARYFRANRMPRVPGPQWEKMVQPALASMISPKRPSSSTHFRAMEARLSSSQVSTMMTRLVSMSVRPSSRSRT